MEKTAHQLVNIDTFVHTMQALIPPNIPHLMLQLLGQILFPFGIGDSFLGS